MNRRSLLRFVGNVGLLFFLIKSKEARVQTISAHDAGASMKSRGVKPLLKLDVSRFVENCAVVAHHRSSFRVEGGTCSNYEGKSMRGLHIGYPKFLAHLSGCCLLIPSLNSHLFEPSVHCDAGASEQARGVESHTGNNCGQDHQPARFGPPHSFTAQLSPPHKAATISSTRQRGEGLSISGQRLKVLWNGEKGQE